MVKKTITKNLIMNNLTPKGLAYWYMDDGGRNYYTGKRASWDMTCTINTQSFSVKEVLILIDELNKKFNLNCHLIYNKKKPIITIPNKHYEEFYNLVNPYILNTFRYKLPKKQ